MQNDEIKALVAAPCPTCKQYSHTLRTDEIGEAILHFETMIQLEHKSYPTMRAFDDKTRDMAQRLVSTLTSQADEIERLRKLARPQWFYYGDDCSSDQCRDSVHECIDGDFLWGNNAEGSHVLEISTATNLPTIWALVRFFTEDEKNARDSDDDYEVTEFASEDEARAALKAAQEVKA